MEKSRSCTTSKRYSRLLIIFVLLSIHLPTLFAQDLRFNQVDIFTVGANSEFIVEITGVSPAEIEILYKDLPSDIDFVSSTKSDAFLVDANGKHKKGTRITYIVCFLESKTYSLGFLDVRINSILYSIEFPTVLVSKNPDILLPELYLVPEGSVYQFENTTLVLTGRYFKRIEGIDWDLSETALIEKNASSMALPSEDFSFSEDSTTIATFLYMPLESGQLVLPKIEVDIIAYNGHPYTISPIAPPLSVLEPLTTKISTQDDYYTEKPLTVPIDTATQLSQVAVSDDRSALVMQLASLRSKERHQVFPFFAKNERIALEKTVNLHNVGELSVVWTIVCAVFSFPLFLIGLLLYKKRKKAQDKRGGLSFLCIILAIMLAGWTIFSVFKLSGQSALTFESQLRTIPEYQTSSLITLFPGMKVDILSSAGDWYLVSLEDKRSGWILKNECILIK